MDNKNMLYVKPCRDGTYKVMKGSKVLKADFTNKMKAEAYMRKKKRMM